MTTPNHTRFKNILISPWSAVSDKMKYSMRAKEDLESGTLLYSLGSFVEANRLYRSFIEEAPSSMKGTKDKMKLLIMSNNIRLIAMEIERQGELTPQISSDIDTLKADIKAEIDKYPYNPLMAAHNRFWRGELALLNFIKGENKEAKDNLALKSPPSKRDSFSILQEVEENMGFLKHSNIIAPAYIDFVKTDFNNSIRPKKIPRPYANRR